MLVITNGHNYIRLLEQQNYGITEKLYLLSIVLFAMLSSDSLLEQQRA